MLIPKDAQDNAWTERIPPRESQGLGSAAFVPSIEHTVVEKMNVSSLEILACCPSLKKIKVWNVSQLELIPQQIQSCRGLEEISLKFCSDLETVSD